MAESQTHGIKRGISEVSDSTEVGGAEERDSDIDDEEFTSMQMENGDEFFVSADGAVYVEEADGGSLQEVGKWNESTEDIILFDDDDDSHLDVGAGELEGALPPRTHQAGSGNDVGRTLLSAVEIDAFRKESLLVMDDFLSLEEVAATRKEVRSMSHAFTPSANSRLGVRHDLVGWVKTRSDVKDGDGTGLSPGPNLKRALRRLEGLVFELNTNSHSGVENLLLPCQAMIGSYEGGGFFHAHKDNETLGKSAGWTNPREVTAVLYINEGEIWEAERGGCLKCHVAGGRVRNVQPNGGRLVLFKSRELLHEVTKIKPGSAGLPRLAITLWAVKHIPDVS